MELTGGGRRFVDLCRDLYALAQGASHDAAGVRGPERGWSWEARVADVLSRRGFPAEPLPGGVRVFGAVPASGLRHQTDAAVHCADALVVGEWKSYSGPVPKNELLRFKAATDDLYDSLAVRLPRRPVLRLFGVAGDVSPQLRWYAARHGIALIERSRWPAPVLADPLLPWPDGQGPAATDLRRLRWLARPMQEAYPRLLDGSLRLPPPPPAPAIDALLALQDRWSDRLWAALDARPGSFEAYAGTLAA